MVTEAQAGTVDITASEAQAAEATMIRQPETHTIAAAQVFGEQRDSAPTGFTGLALVP